ncbi:MAG: glutaminase [Candidatus Woesearchaeota archaeon]|nr:glutaminase [Candidatus Woesearchaeota archaeon]
MLEETISENTGANSRPPLRDIGLEQDHLEEAAALGLKFSTYGRLNKSVPILSEANPHLYGILVGSLNREDTPLYVGTWDPEKHLPIESVAKVLTQGYSLQELKIPASVLARRESPGDVPFNVHENIPTTGPGDVADACHPYYNQGGIASSEFKWADFQQWVRDILEDQTITYDQDVFDSEISCDFANRTIAEKLAAGPAQRFGADPATAFERATHARFNYTKACSLDLKLHHLLRFGQILANDGVDVSTGRQVFTKENARMLTEDMETGGLYEDSAFYFNHSGVYAKSSISGIVFGVVKGRGAFVAYGPELGLKGNSEFAVATLRRMGQLLGAEAPEQLTEDAARERLYAKKEHDEVAFREGVLQEVINTGKPSGWFKTSGATERAERQANPALYAINDALTEHRRTHSTPSTDPYETSYTPPFSSICGSVIYSDVGKHYHPEHAQYLPEEQLPEVTFVRETPFSDRWKRFELPQGATAAETEGFVKIGTYDPGTQTDTLFNTVAAAARSSADILRVRKEADTITVLAA